MLVSIAIGGGAKPHMVAGSLEGLGVDGATLWVCEGYGKGWPLEKATMIRLSLSNFGEAILITRRLAQAYDEEAAYLEWDNVGYLVYNTGAVRTVL